MEHNGGIFEIDLSIDMDCPTYDRQGESFLASKYLVSTFYTVTLFTLLKKIILLRIDLKPKKARICNLSINNNFYI